MTKTAREEAYILGKQKGFGKPMKRATILEVFTAPTMHRMDIEGQMASCKAWIDGLVDAGIIEDDDWTHILRMSGYIVYKKGVEGTDITLTEVA